MQPRSDIKHHASYWQRRAKRQITAIVAIAGAINVMTGFRGFKPSWLGKASTFVQVIAVIIILFATVFPANNGLFLPTTYVVVAAFAVFSGIHYIFHVAKLMREDEKRAVTS